MNLYASPERIANEIAIALTPEERAILKLSSKQSMIRYHHTVGRFIRNHYRLWDEENPYTDVSDPSDDHHPDQVSHTILEKVWERVHAR